MYPPRCLFLTVSLSLSLPLTASGAPYGDPMTAAARCRQAIQTSQTITLNSGVYTERARVSTPLSVRVPGPMDPREFAACMAGLGFVSDVYRDRYLRVLQACQADGAVNRVLSYEPRARSLSGGGGEAVEACVRQHLRGPEVEVLAPAAGK